MPSAKLLTKSTVQLVYIDLFWGLAYSLTMKLLPVSYAKFKLHSQNFKLVQNVPLTSVCWVHSNVYGLSNIHCIRYHTTVDSLHSTSPAMHKYYHLISGYVEVPLCANCIVNNCTGKSTSIQEEPVPYAMPHFTSKMLTATSSIISYAEQGISPFTNVLQGHKTVVLICYTSQKIPDTLTCTWEGNMPYWVKVQVLENCTYIYLDLICKTMWTNRQQSTYLGTPLCSILHTMHCIVHLWLYISLN